MAIASNSIQTRQDAPRQATRLLYAGPRSDAVLSLLDPAAGRFACQAEARVSAALMLAASKSFDVVVVDQRDDDDALTLLIAALAASQKPPRIIVLAQPEAVGRFLRYPGVHSVLTLPLRAAQLRTALASAHPKSSAKPALAAPQAEARLAQSPGLRRRLLSTGRFMATISALYKNAAFVLLATLFAAFTFYGFLIAFFLLSSGWGAPVTLSKGHELVAKAQREIGELKIALNVTAQRLSEAQLGADTAERAHGDAQLLVEYVKGTVDQEIDARQAALKTVRSKLKRLARVKAEFDAQLKSGGMSQALAKLYRKRLIDKRTYEAGTLGLLETTQRMAAIDTDIEAARDVETQASVTITLLTSLRQQLVQGKMSGVTAATADLVLLTKQAVDARSALDQALVQLQSAHDSQKILSASMALMEQQVADLEQSPFGRARRTRVDVIFVPYGNERGFVAGASLYTCALTVVICHRAGTVGQVLPGESNTVHPFFGKPLRGFFVEAKLDDEAAAAQEIIHAGRAPFFF